MSTALVTHGLPGLDRDQIANVVGQFEQLVDCDHRPETIRSHAEAINAEAIVCLLTDRIDEQVLSLPGLKIVANVAVGYDNIDVEAARRYGVMVSNTPGVLDETTADLTFALILAVARRLVEGDRMVRQGDFRGWGMDMLLGSDVYQSTLGIIGLGRIGRALARRAAGFDMRVLYHNRNRLEANAESALGVEHATMDVLLSQSDFVCCMVPLSPHTYHLIDEPQLSRMKTTAYLINTSRGPVINETALAEALQAGVIAGAGLDVYENEPDLAPGLANLNNVTLLPHIGSASLATRRQMGMVALRNAAAVLGGRRPHNLVKP